MARKAPKTAVVAFKVEEELAEFLNDLPNKSAFIRKAIVAQMSMACPLCHGSGQVSRWVHDNFAAMQADWTLRKCDGCGHHLDFPKDPGSLSEEHQTRLEQFFKGGPLYCDPCFEKAPPCGDCGMHIAPEKTKEHRRHIHRN